jgi:hypothetical protein
MLRWLWIANSTEQSRACRRPQRRNANRRIIEFAFAERHSRERLRDRTPREVRDDRKNRYIAPLF